MSGVKTGYVTLGQLPTVSWSQASAREEEFDPPPCAPRAHVLPGCPCLVSARLRMFWSLSGLKCFQRQWGCSTTVPRKLVHVGRSLPENEVICSFFIFCCLSPSTRLTGFCSLPAQTRPAEGAGRAGCGKGRGAGPQGAESARHPLSALAPVLAKPPGPTRDFPGTALKVSPPNPPEAARAPARLARQTITVNNAPLST